MTPSLPRRSVLKAGAALTGLTITGAPSGAPIRHNPTPADAQAAILAAYTAPAWAEGNTYTVGAQVTYQGHTYQALQTHTAYPGTGRRMMAESP